jgi:hypothetical protein
MLIGLYDGLDFSMGIKAALGAFGVVLSAVGALRLEVGIERVLSTHTLSNSHR